MTSDTDRLERFLQLASLAHPEFAQMTWPRFWRRVSLFLDSFTTEKCHTDLASLAPKKHHRPLPEDYHVQGQVWAQGYFPEGWFKSDGRVEYNGAGAVRHERVQHLASKLAICEAN